MNVADRDMQSCRWVFKSGWASSNVVGIICPLVVIGLTELTNSEWAKAHPAYLLAASLITCGIFGKNQLFRNLEIPYSATYV